MELELVPVPVSDIERSKTCYTEQLGFAPDVDVGGGVTYAWFADPAGNTSPLQQMDWRTGEAF